MLDGRNVTMWAAVDEEGVAAGDTEAGGFEGFADGVVLRELQADVGNETVEVW